MKRNYWIALAGLLIVIGVAAGAWYWWYPSLVAQQQQTAAPPTPRPLAAPSPANPAGPVAPSFDAVNVGPDGSAVIAGRAAPGAEVTVLAGGKPVGHATADANGEWVAMTDRPLPSGPQSLSLSAREPGKPPLASSSSLALVVPPHGAPTAPVAVVLPPAGEAAHLLGGGTHAPRHIALDIVEYDANGRTVLSGGADPGTQVTIAVDGHTLGTVTADGKGAWSASLAAGVPTGRYRLTLAGRESDGGDAAGIALAMRRPAQNETGDYLAIVPGNTLWHLAARSYGDGLRYVEIAHANEAQVENPNRIYPGQVLALPVSRNP